MGIHLSNLNHSHYCIDNFSFPIFNLRRKEIIFYRRVKWSHSLIAQEQNVLVIIRNYLPLFTLKIVQVTAISYYTKEWGMTLILFALKKSLRDAVRRNFGV